MIDVEQVCSFFARTLIFRLPNRAKGSDTSIKFPRSDLFSPLLGWLHLLVHSLFYPLCGDFQRQFLHLFIFLNTNSSILNDCSTLVILSC